MARTCSTCGFKTEEEVAVCPVDGSPVILVDTSDPFIGTMLLGKYEITELLGRGGMSAVYKARHTLMDRWVAIKILKKELIGDNTSLLRFRQESQAVSLIQHPNVVNVHDFGVTENGIPYLIMDYLKGRTIATILAQDGLINPARAVFLYFQACQALGHAHSKGVVHRDIKPGNLIVSDDGDKEVLKLVDFGIAKFLAPDLKAPKLTAAGEIFGSPFYMSPEQCRGAELDARSDVYSLGCVIYESLVGKPPIVGTDPFETFFKHIQEMPPDFRTVQPDILIPEALEATVFKALAKEPEQRFQTMAEFGSALRASFKAMGDTGSMPISTIGLSDSPNKEPAPVGKLEAANHAPPASEAAPPLVQPATQSNNTPAVHKSETDKQQNAEDRKLAAAGAKNQVIAENQSETSACPTCERENPTGLVYCPYCGRMNDPERTVSHARYYVCPDPNCRAVDAFNIEYCALCGTKISQSDAEQIVASCRTGLRWGEGSSNQARPAKQKSSQARANHKLPSIVASVIGVLAGALIALFCSQQNWFKCIVGTRACPNGGLVISVKLAGSAKQIPHVRLEENPEVKQGESASHSIVVDQDIAPDGVLAIPTLKDGRYRLYITAKGYQSAFTQITVKESYHTMVGFPDPITLTPLGS